MGEERLSDLAQISIQTDVCALIDFKDLLNTFAEANARRVIFKWILCLIIAQWLASLYLSLFVLCNKFLVYLFLIAQNNPGFLAQGLNVSRGGAVLSHRQGV